MEKIPKFKTAKEEAEFWETHSPLHFSGEFEEVKEPIVDRRGRKKGIYIRIDPGAIEVARKVGAQLGIGYQTLFRTWMMEGLGRYLTTGAEEDITSSLRETVSDMPLQLRRMLLDHLASCDATARAPQRGQHASRSPSQSTPPPSRLIDSGNLDVLVSGGVVHIDGEVDSYQQKKAISRLLAASPGVRRVVNRLRVAPAAPVSDSALAQRVRQALRAEPALGGQGISVSARGGHVELKGAVDAATARLDAEYAAWHVPGVRQVTNKLHIGLEERELGRRLEEALHWCLEVEPWRISIEVDKGVAYLSGHVPSRKHAREAEDLVRWHPQISDVVNRLTVEAAATAWAGGEADVRPA